MRLNEAVIATVAALTLGAGCKDVQIRDQMEHVGETREAIAQRCPYLGNVKLDDLETVKLDDLETVKLPDGEKIFVTTGRECAWDTRKNAMLIVDEIPSGAECNPDQTICTFESGFEGNPWVAEAVLSNREYIQWISGKSVKPKNWVEMSLPIDPTNPDSDYYY